MRIYFTVFCAIFLGACSSPQAKVVDGELLMYGVQVPGNPGFVYSPHNMIEIVDVRGIPKDKKVKCPHTGKIFLVPGGRLAGTRLAPENATALAAFSNGMQQQTRMMTAPQPMVRYQPQPLPVPQIQPMQMTTPTFTNPPSQNATIWHSDGSSTRASGNTIWHPDGTSSRITY